MNDHLMNPMSSTLTPMIWRRWARSNSRNRRYRDGFWKSSVLLAQMHGTRFSDADQAPTRRRSSPATIVIWVYAIVTDVGGANAAVCLCPAV